MPPRLNDSMFGHTPQSSRRTSGAQRRVLQRRGLQRNPSNSNPMMSLVNFPAAVVSQSDMGTISRYYDLVRPAPWTRAYGSTYILERPLTPIHDMNYSIAIEALPERTIESPDGEKTSQCSICYEEWKTGDIVKTLHCFHYFHKACICPWLQTNMSCPNCRYRLPANVSSEPIVT
jgi:hypothetical protein